MVYTPRDDLHSGFGTVLSEQVRTERRHYGWGLLKRPWWYATPEWENASRFLENPGFAVCIIGLSTQALECPLGTVPVLQQVAWRYKRGRKAALSLRRDGHQLGTRVASG